LISYVRHLKREYHHVARTDAEPIIHEPTMIIFDENRQRRSFQIPQEAIWKYLDPKDNKDAREWDGDDFEELMIANRDQAQFLAHRKQIHRGGGPTDPGLRRASMEFAISMQALEFAIRSQSRDPRILLCTYYNLAVCLQLMEITLNNDSAAQLLMFIQDGLDELKNMAPHVEDPGPVVGEVTLSDGGTKIGTREVRVSDTELQTDEL
jgi:hypothetical protein